MHPDNSISVLADIAPNLTSNRVVNITTLLNGIGKGTPQQVAQIVYCWWSRRLLSRQQRSGALQSWLTLNRSSSDLRASARRGCTVVADLGCSSLNRESLFFTRSCGTLYHHYHQSLMQNELTHISQIRAAIWWKFLSSYLPCESSLLMSAPYFTNNLARSVLPWCAAQCNAVSPSSDATAIHLRLRGSAVRVC